MNILQEFDTITAVATPLGTGGVGVIRISGPESFQIIDKIFSKNNLQAQRIYHGWIKDNDTKIDEVIVLPFKAPRSYTGEDVIEINCHGGINIVKTILDLVLQNGARPAERGEFTKRAFLNKKLDLSQAEAVADLIHAKTKNFALKSAKNLSGVLSEKIKEIRQELFEVLSRITAGIDFPEDVKEPEYSYLTEKFKTSLAKINEILDSAKSSDIMRQGIKAAVAGRPNVGKSSLFNALLNINRAIVTDIAGTTRDVIKETLDWDIAITLIDTAGIRDCREVEKVEEIGIEFSKQSIDEADLILFLYDAKTGITPDDKVIFDIIKHKDTFIIANKSDLLTEEEVSANVNRYNDETLYISAKTKSGLKELKELIKQKTSQITNEDTEFITNKRQQNCLERSKKALTDALTASERHELQDLISIDVKSALLCLDEITGEVITDEILENIFEHFCIGK